MQGVTEDAFLSAVLKLSLACLGGIDAQLSEVSSDRSWEGDTDDEGGPVLVSAGDKRLKREETAR